MPIDVSRRLWYGLEFTDRAKSPSGFRQKSCSSYQKTNSGIGIAIFTGHSPSAALSSEIVRSFLPQTIDPVIAFSARICFQMQKSINKGKPHPL